MVDGKRHGRWVERFVGGEVNEGPYVEDKKHGQWVVRSPTGSTSTVTFADGVQQ